MDRYMEKVVTEKAKEVQEEVTELEKKQTELEIMRKIVELSASIVSSLMMAAKEAFFALDEKRHMD